MKYPGEVYYLPPEDGGDPKARPHVLLTTVSAGTDVASFAFCSRQGTEAGYGAHHVLVNPYSSQYRNTGLTDATFVYPSRLVAVEPELLDGIALAGRIIDEMSAIRTRLHEALGVGTGSCHGGGAAAGSVRGRLLQLTRWASEQIGAPFALAACDPLYAQHQRYVNILPVLDARHHHALEGDVLVEGAAWLDGLGYERAIIATSITQSVFYPEGVSRPMECALDDSGMADVDTALRLHFGLP